MILLVEDDPDLSELIVLALAETGEPVSVAPDAATALRALRDGPRPRLLILDLMIPGGGEQVLEAREADEALRQVPVLLSSGSHRKSAAVGERFRLPSAARLPKPFDVDELVARVRALVH